MCFALPLKILSVEKDFLVVTKGKKTEKVNRILLKERVKRGDYVLVQNNFALRRISPSQAKKIFSLLENE